MSDAAKYFSKWLTASQSSEEAKQCAAILYNDGDIAMGDRRLNHLAALTWNAQACDNIFRLLENAISPSEAPWKTIYKALLIMNTILLYGSELSVDRCINMCKFIHPLRQYNSALARKSMFSSGGTDYGAPVRAIATSLTDILMKDENIRAARAQVKDQNTLVPLGEMPEENHNPSKGLMQQMSYGQGLTSSVGAGFGLEAVPGMYEGRPERYFDNTNDPRNRTTQGNSQITRDKLAPDLLDLVFDAPASTAALPDAQYLPALQKQQELEQKLKEQQELLRKLQEQQQQQQQLQAQTQVQQQYGGSNSFLLDLQQSTMPVPPTTSNVNMGYSHQQQYPYNSNNMYNNNQANGVYSGYNNNMQQMQAPPSQQHMGNTNTMMFQNNTPNPYMNNGMYSAPSHQQIPQQNGMFVPVNSVQPGVSSSNYVGNGSYSAMNPAAPANINAQIAPMVPGGMMTNNTATTFGSPSTANVNNMGYNNNVNAAMTNTSTINTNVANGMNMGNAANNSSMMPRPTPVDIPIPDQDYINYFSAQYQSHSIHFDDAAPPPTVAAQLPPKTRMAMVGVLSRGNSWHENQVAGSPLHWSFDHNNTANNAALLQANNPPGGNHNRSTPSMLEALSTSSASSPSTSYYQRNPNNNNSTLNANLNNAYGQYAGPATVGNNGNVNNNPGMHQNDMFADIPMVPPPPPPPVPSFQPPSDL